MEIKDEHHLAALLRPTLLSPAEVGHGLKLFGSAAALKSAPSARLRSLGLSPDRAARACAAWSALDPKVEALRLVESGITAVAWDSTAYPIQLRQIPDPPPLLFVRGDAAVLSSSPSLAVVGSRRLTPYGRSAVRLLVEPCARRGVTVTSGLAYGVDAAAHQAALLVHGRTVAVLASGVDRASVGPRANLQMSEEIIATGGCLVSERPPGAAADKRAFPQRNRIIAGLAPVTLIIEAASKSGSLITARYALEFNREVLAVPGPITSAVSEGTNRLIAQGAAPALTADDVLEALGIQPSETNLPRPSVTDPVQKCIIAALSDFPRTVDEIIAATEESPAIVIAALMELETAGFTTQNGDLVELSTGNN